MRVIRSGYAAAGVGAAALGIVGYFDIAGLGPLFTLYDNVRASGPFKDPNVFGPFLMPPIVWTAQDLLLGRARRPLLAALAIATMTLGAFLSFSRGAWGDYAGIDRALDRVDAAHDELAETAAADRGAGDRGRDLRPRHARNRADNSRNPRHVR